MVRRMPDSLVKEFGPRLLAMDWSCLEDGTSPDVMVDQFQAAATWLVDQLFPMKQVTIIDGDLPYFTEECRKLRRQRDHAYQRGGKSPTYFIIQADFQAKLENQANKYKEKIVSEVNSGKRGSGYKAIRQLGETTADKEKKKEFTIPYIEEGLSAQESADRLASHFSAISQSVDPIDINNFSPALRLEIQQGKCSKDKPVLSQHEVYRNWGYCS